MTKAPRGMEEASREYKLEDTALQIKKIGNSVGVILPKELLARLNLKEGDKFYPVEQPDGGLRLSPYDPKHATDHGNRAAGHARLPRYVCSACKMSEPIWLDVDDGHRHARRATGDIRRPRTAFAIEGMLESASCRPINKWTYGQTDIGCTCRGLCVWPCPKSCVCRRQQAHRVPRHDGLLARATSFPLRPTRRTPRPSSSPSRQARSTRKA